MKIQNYYKLLNLSQDSSTEALYEDCKALFIKYHPDNNKTKEANTKFIFVNDAYVVLLDEKIRKKYDYLLSKYSEEKPIDSMDKEMAKRIEDRIINKRKVFQKTQGGNFLATLIADLPSVFLPMP